jgi:hypothetical protein
MRIQSRTVKIRKAPENADAAGIEGKYFQR